MYDSDPLDAERLRELVVGELGSGGLWQQVDVVSQTGSTNADLSALAASGSAPSGSVLLTTYQSSGRGRLDRTWSAPPGASLALSMFVLPPDVDWQHWTWLPLICGMAVSEGIHRATGVETVLKWPNDVMVGDRKLCGILAERVSTPHGPGCVIGVGINTDLTEDQLPVPWATSLLLAGASTRNKTTVAATVLRAFALLYENWQRDFDAEALSRAYVARCATIGREVRVVLSGQESVTGRAVAIDDDGRLVVRTVDGSRVFGAGDVVHLR